MPIAFRSLQPTEYTDICGIQIEKRGCLKVAEEAALRQLHELLNSELSELSPLQSDLEIKYRAATILIQSRLEPSWTLEKTKAPRWTVEVAGVEQLIEPDMILLEGLYEFLMMEQRRGKTEAEVLAENSNSENGGTNASKKRLIGTKSTGS